MTGALSWTVQGFTSPAESKALADKVIRLISEYEGTPDEMERLERYLRQEHRYTKAQEWDIESMWVIYDSRKKKWLRR